MPADSDQLRIDSAHFLEQLKCMMEEYATDCFCAVDEAIMREPHGLSEQRQALLLEGSTSMYDVAIRRVREESGHFASQALQSSLGFPAGLDHSENQPLEGRQAPEGAKEETKLEAEMDAMRTRLAAVRQEVQLLVDPTVKLRACLASSSKMDGSPGSTGRKENVEEDAAAVSSALQSLKSLLVTARQLQETTVTVKTNAMPFGEQYTGMSITDQDMAVRQDRPLPQLCDIPHGAIPQIIALLDQAG